MAKKARILAISYDETLLRTRQMMLEGEGYEVTSALGFVASLEQCQRGGFDLFVLGHSIPHEEKQKLVATFKRFCPAPIISLRRNAGEQVVDGADYHIEPDPEPVIKLFTQVLRGNAAAH